MPFGASRTVGSGGENVNHFNAVRMRVVGTGSLQMSLFSEDDIYSQTLVPFTLAATTNVRPTRLANFIQQRAILEIKTTVINEFVRISFIAIFAKQFGSEYPQ